MQRYDLSELDSGMRVVTERVRGVRSVAIGFWIGAGSRDERSAKAGASHFIEHLLFKGSRNYTAQEIASIFDRLGGELNAATSRENTVVYARVPDDKLELAINVITDMVYTPLFAELDAERAVVLEEIAMYEDTPQEYVHDLISEAVFGRHPLGRPVVGEAAVIRSISRRSLASYHRAMYAPGNVVVAAVGNLEHDRLLSMLEAAAGKATEGPRRPIRSPLVRAPAPGLRFQQKRTEQYHVCLAAPGIARSDRRRFVVSLLDAILGGSASSRLFQEIREKRGMAYSVYTFASQYTDTGQVGLYVATREDNLRECLDVAVEQILDIASGNLSSDELERAKDNLKSRIMLSMESTSNRMSRLGKSLITNTEILSLPRIIAEVDAVTTEAVADLAGLLLAPERLSAAGIGPRQDRFMRAVERVTPSLVARASGMKVALFGAEGKVGTVLAAALAAEGHEVTPVEVGDDVALAGHDAIVDFTQPDAVAGNVLAAVEQGVPAVVGTTGLKAEQLERIDAAAKERGVAVFIAPNFAIGAVLMMRFAAQAARFMPRAEIIELHHDTKVDAPSGTAKATAALIGDGTAIHSVRLPGLVAHQEVLFGGPGQTLSIRHDTMSREAFVPGVLLALAQLETLPPGLTVGLDALLD